jgi:ABC-2 type transport system permease protein
MPLAFVTGAGFGQFFTVYLMLILYGGAALSLGIWIGLWVSSYIPSILITTVVLGLVTYLHAIPRFSFVPVSLHSFLVSLSFVWHFESAARGILDSRDIVFYGIPAVLFLMCGTLVLSNKRRQS